MEREKIYIFKSNSRNAQKISNFSKLNPIGKRMVWIVINLVIGGSQMKNIVKCLREKNIISNYKSNERMVQKTHTLLENS